MRRSNRNARRCGNSQLSFFRAKVVIGPGAPVVGPSDAGTGPREFAHCERGIALHPEAVATQKTTPVVSMLNSLWLVIPMIPALWFT